MRHLLFAALTLAALPALAGGYAVHEQDAAATGRAGTGTAALGGASSVHYNPANLSRVFSLDAAVGGTGIVPLVSAEDPADASLRSSAGVALKTPPHAYAAYGNGKFGVGLGFNAPFGGGVRWPDDFSGRFEIVEQDLSVLAGHVGVAYQLRPELSLGLTGTLYRAGVSVEKRIDFVDREGTALLSGSGVGFGAQLGVSYAPSELVRLGLTARLPTYIGMSGRAHFSDVPESFGPMLQDQEISAGVPIPARVALGSAFYLDSIRLFADVDYTMWSAFDRFAVDFAQSDSLDVSQRRDWTNAFSVRVGTEYDLSDVWMVRGGLFFDQKTSPEDTLSPSSPDSDRVGFSLGGGRDFGLFRADASYMFLVFIPRSSTGETFPATYNASAHMVGLTLRMATPPGVASHKADTSDNRPLIDTSAPAKTPADDAPSR